MERHYTVRTMPGGGVTLSIVFLGEDGQVLHSRVILAPTEPEAWEALRPRRPAEEPISDSV